MKIFLEPAREALVPPPSFPFRGRILGLRENLNRF